MRAIVGSGISGLAIAACDRNSLCIGPSSNFSIPDPFTFVHATDLVMSFLEDILGKEERIGVANVKITVPSSVEPSSVATGKSPEGPFTMPREVGMDRVGGVSKNGFLVAVDLPSSRIKEAIEKRLLSEGRLVRASVRKISRTSNGKFCIFTDDAQIEADEIVSTVHFDVFERLFSEWSPGSEIVAGDHLAVVDKLPEGNKRGSEIRYSSDTAMAPSKTVTNTIERVVGEEYTNQAAFDRVKSLPSVRVTRRARFSGRLAPPPEGVIFAGRFATGRPRWRIEDSIFLAKEGLALSKMFSEQAMFDETLIRRASINRDERPTLLLFHLFSEVAELQREIVWKKHRKVHSTSKLTSVLEEATDCVKIILSLLNHYGITEREFFQSFRDKSSVVWSRFMDEFYGGV